MENMNNSLSQGSCDNRLYQNNFEDSMVTTPIVRSNTGLPQYDKITREYADIVKTLATVQMNLSNKLLASSFLKCSALDRNQQKRQYLRP